MPLFETGIVQVSTVGTLPVAHLEPVKRVTTTFGSLGSITTGDVLKDVTIINTGSGTVYAAGGTTVAGAAPIGIAIPPGGQVTIQGYNVTAASDGPGWPICALAATGASSSVKVGLASVASVV